MRCSLKYIFITFVTFVVLFFLLNFFYPLNVARLNKPQSTLIYDRNHQLISMKLSSDGFLRIPIKKEALNSNVKKITLAYEDQYFEKHFGVNPFAIVRALWFNLTNQRRIGASTITMQVARMMHHESRTLIQKLIEMFNALQLEFYYSKDEILTFYLNNAPYGGNVEGFASASFYYFNLEPSSLSLSQIAYLTAIPKNPNANRPKAKCDINAIKNRLLKRIFALNLLDKNDYKRAVEEQIVVNIKKLPHAIPHLRALIKEEGEVFTTIDIALQSQIEKLLAQEVEEKKKYGIHNASVLVIENKSMKIRAYVASQNFNDNKHGGQNNGIRSLISPGSTLKPFVYAKALEEGLITPLKKVFDVPLFIEGYHPTNYSKEYLGEVTATEALQNSLNIPAVELDRLLKKESLYGLLKKSQITSLTHKKSYYGASLTLGGLGISVQEIAELFATLANGGLFQKSTYLQNQTKEKPTRLLSKASSYLVSQILVNAPRRSFSSSWEYIKNMPKVAFKTGTSAHAKDLLTIGYTPDYTVALWYGNFSAKSTHAHNGVYPSGIRIASPSMFKVFKLLGKQSWFVKPKNIQTQEVCQDAIVLGECQKKVNDELIKNVKLQDDCALMRAEVLSYLQKQGKLNKLSILQEHRCYETWRTYKPLITSPLNGRTYTYNQDLPKELKKTKLECYSFEENQTIYWLIDQKPPIKAKSAEAFYHYLEPKEHQISCVDEGAKIRSVELFVEER